MIKPAMNSKEVRRFYLMVIGRTAEYQIGQSIKQKMSVIPLGDLPGGNGHGPRALDEGEGITLPDFDLAGMGYRGFCDVKLKSGPNKRDNRQRWEQGIDLVAYDSYCKIEKRYQRPVVLFVAEIVNEVILAATLSDLRAFGNQRIGPWIPGGTKMAINWDRKAFIEIAKFRIPNYILTEMVIDWDWKAIKNMKRQIEMDIDYAEELVLA